MPIENHIATTQNAGFARPRVISLIDGNVLRRAGVVAIVLGSVLTAVKQPDAVFGSGAVQVLPLVLVYLTPFVVVAISQMLGRRRAVLDAWHGSASGLLRGGLLATIASHGIPLRALLLGLAVGIVNASIVVSSALMDRGNISAVPAALLAQAFVLPMLFGMVSQAIGYRRQTAALAHKGQVALSRA